MKKTLKQDALHFHSFPKPGKLEITPTKPLTTQRDLSLAYSPGVAEPCLRIEKDKEKAYDYTSKGNLVAVVSNGTAVLGLGNIGATASKPVMEGKAVLFKKFADIDSVDLEIDTEDVNKFVEAVSLLGPSFGGINLEDIKSPECFIIEQRLRDIMDIPVFHDDQHGTAIIALAGLINGLDLTNRSVESIKVVCNGAGAASIACVELIKAIGVKPENIILCDSEGVIFKGRTSRMNQWKSAHANPTNARSLSEALVNADVFFGLSVAKSLTPKMIKTMNKEPIIFAMANPEPEIMPDIVKKYRPDAIIATGRSDFPNQVNNVLGFPYIFRGALDVRASAINDEMKIAAAKSIALLAREDVPDVVNNAYSGANLRYGKEYIIPAPFDPRLISHVSSAVAESAMKTGVARKPIKDLNRYKLNLSARLDPTASFLQKVFNIISPLKKRIVFAEGEEDMVIRAAYSFRNSGYGLPILIGREDIIRDKVYQMGIESGEELEITNAKISSYNKNYIRFLYNRLRRKGFLERDCQRMVNQDRNVFAACMVANSHADALVTGLTRSFKSSFENISLVIDPAKNKEILTTSLLISKGRTVFIGDTSIHEKPSGLQMSEIAIAIAEKAKSIGHVPRVAFLSFSNFGNFDSPITDSLREAVKILDNKNVEFEYEGEMTVDIALDFDLMKSRYPFSRLSGPANILIMPGIHSANISFNLMQQLGGGSVIGPMILNAKYPFQIIQMGSTVNDLVNSAALAAYESIK